MELEFPAASNEERQAALDGSFGNLEDALQLLSSFKEQDEAQQGRTGPQDLSPADAAAILALADEAPPPGPDPGDPLLDLSAEQVSKLQLLALFYPNVSTEALAVARHVTGFDVDAAKGVLWEQANDGPPPEKGGGAVASNTAAAVMVVPAEPVPYYVRNQQIYEVRLLNDYFAVLYSFGAGAVCSVGRFPH